MKQLFMIVLALSCFGVQAQVKFGVKGGMNFSKFHFSEDIVVEEDGVYSDWLYRAGFHAGFMAEIPLVAGLSVQPELLFSTKGVVQKYGVPKKSVPSMSGYAMIAGLDAKYSCTPLYMELPVYLKESIPTGTVGKILVGAGPYIAVGVGGKYRADMVIDTGTKTSHKGKLSLYKPDEFTFTQDYTVYKFNNQGDMIKRFDAGFAGFAGYELGMGLFVTVNYDWGLYHINHSDSAVKIHNRTLSVSAGYKF